MSVATLGPTVDSESAFIRQAHQLVKDLMAPRPAVYWADFLLSAAVGYLALGAYFVAPMWSPLQAAGLIVASLALYRTSIFTHELAHLPPTRFRLFRLAWNVGFGIPFLVPSFIYTDHRVHHTNQTYGTGGDAEYFPFGRSPVRALVVYFLVVPTFPLFPVIRFGVLGPLSLLHPRLRQLVWQRASSLGTLSPAYRRAAPDEHDRRSAPLQEVSCFAVVVALFALPAAGVVPWTVLAKLYFVYLLVMAVNTVRVCAAHSYVGGGEPMSFLDQMRDSTTIPGGPWSALWAPLGMRYHALHHLFPAMPYHAMGRAHRRLMAGLPAGSPYHATLRPSLMAALAVLLRTARGHGQPESFRRAASL